MRHSSQSTLSSSHSCSSNLYEQACKVIPGGVNSPVRAFSHVGGNPLFIRSAQGAYITDVDGKEYIDYVGSWGPMILGHNNEQVKAAVIDAAQKGLSFGAPTPAEVEMAQLITSLMPSIEKVRMVNSGTEATMSAIRLARGYTGRDKFIKFEGCYHGHADALLVKAGSGALTSGRPDSLGVPADFVKHTLSCIYNDIASVKAMFEVYPQDIAAIIVEPVAGNMGCVPPVNDFLKKLRALCDQYGALLIIDEVMTGFRVALGGAQSYYDVVPDITTLGKIIGGGMPVGAFGGRKEIMDCLTPVGGVYQAGTLSGNPVAMAAGLACLKVLKQENNEVYLADIAHQLAQGMRDLANKHHIPFVVNQVGAMFGFFFSRKPQVTSFADVMACDKEMFVRFFQLMLEQGIYLAPSPFESGFISLAHGQKEIKRTLEAVDYAFVQLAREKSPQ